jgi:cytoskeletal protein CcmA (bactofilin family)
MKRITKFTLLLVVLACLILPSTVFAKGIYDDKIVTGGSFTLYSDETLDGNLFIFGGAVTLEEESLVEGDILLMGGTISIDGRVEGDVVGFGGVVRLGETAEVEGDLTAIGAAVHRDPGAVVEGQVIKGIDGPFSFPIPLPILPDVPRIPNVPDVPRVSNFPGFDFGVNPLWIGLGFLFRTFLWAALAVLVVMFFPKPIERTSDAIVAQPILSGGVGLLTVIVVPLLLIIIAITIILIPISLVGALALVLAWFLGRIAIGYEVGRRLAKMLDKDWAPGVSAGVGMFLLALVVDATGQFIHCIGWVFPGLVAVIGIGGLMLTRFGTQSYPPEPETTDVVIDSENSEIKADAPVLPPNDELPGIDEE